MTKYAFIISGKSPIKKTGGYGAYSIILAKVLTFLGYDVSIFGYSSEDNMFVKEYATIYDIGVPFDKLFSFVLPITSLLVNKKMKKVILEKSISKIVFFSLDRWGYGVISLKNWLKKNNIKYNNILVAFSTIKHSQKGNVEGTSIKDHSYFVFFKMWITYYLFSTVYFFIERKVLKEAEKIIVHYDYTKDKIIEQHPIVDKSNFRKIHYYSEFYLRISDTSNNISFNKYPTLVTVSRQDPRKGINIYLHALSVLKKRGIEFSALIGGDGILLDYHKKLVNALKLSSEVKFLGFVDDIEPLLINSDIYIFPAINEGGSGAISLLEAMNVGVPIITTYCDGIPEDFIDGETGLLVPTKDSEAVADAIEKLIKNPELRKKLAENVKEDYKKRFTFDKMREGIKNILLELEREDNNING